jgi:hypothetical protein
LPLESDTWVLGNGASPEATGPTAIFYDVTKLPAKVALARGFYATGDIVVFNSPLEALLAGEFG